MFILRYHEIALKGGNRSFFEARLKDHLKALFGDMPLVKVRNCRDHFRVSGYELGAVDEVEVRLKRVFGVVNFSRVDSVNLESGGVTPLNYEAVCSKGAELVKKYIALQGWDGRPAITFRVSVVRRDKSLPLRSTELARECAERILPRFEDLKVKLDRPEIELFIDWGKEEALLYVNKQPAAGGLPTGTAGKVVSLISAGFDSPVASWMMMRRGATVVFVHFHSYPAVGEESIENVKQLVSQLNQYQLGSRLYLIPLIDYQKFVVAHAEGPLRVLLYRRMMFRLAERVSRQEGAKALVTGESLGQVASQTLNNIHTVDVVATRPVFRPLIGMDKEEIIARAQVIGTAEISAQPYEDCCSLYLPGAPALAARPVQLEEAERALEVARFENELWDAREVIKF